MVHYTLNGEFMSAKEIREIAEEYLGSVAYHLPLEAIASELVKHGFEIRRTSTHGQS